MGNQERQELLDRLRAKADLEAKNRRIELLRQQEKRVKQQHQETLDRALQQNIQDLHDITLHINLTQDLL